MTGTDKQVQQAADLASTVNAAVTGMIASIKSDARYEQNKAQADKMISMWEDRLSKLNACTDAEYIIDFFGGLKSSGNANQDFAAIQSVYKISLNNGYNFK